MSFDALDTLLSNKVHHNHKVHLLKLILAYV